MGGARLIRLVEELGGIDAAISAGHAELKRAGLDDTTIKAFRNYDAGLLEFDTQWLATPHHHLLTWGVSVLRAAAAYEEAQPWAHLRPPLDLSSAGA